MFISKLWQKFEKTTQFSYENVKKYKWIFLAISKFAILEEMASAPKGNIGQSFHKIKCLTDSDNIRQHCMYVSRYIAKMSHNRVFGGFCLHLLVFPFIYQFNSRIETTVSSSLAYDEFRSIPAYSFYTYLFCCTEMRWMYNVYHFNCHFQLHLELEVNWVPYSRKC